MFDNIRFVIYTYEKNIHLAELCALNFIKQNNGSNLKLSIFCNNVKDKKLESSGVNYVNAEVEYSPTGFHFGKTMLIGLKSIEEDYIFFLLDDYFLIDKIKENELQDVLKFIKCENIDYFGFDNIGGLYTVDMFDRIESSCESIFLDKLRWRKKDYQYLYSVQPCIWKKSSYIELLEKYEKISLHDLDNTLEHIKLENSHYKGTACILNSCFDHIDKINDEYFVLAYVEINRHGVFQIPENGMPVNPMAQHVLYTYKLIEEHKLNEKKEFAHMMPPNFQIKQ